MPSRVVNAEVVFAVTISAGRQEGHEPSGHGPPRRHVAIQTQARIAQHSFSLFDAASALLDAHVRELGFTPRDHALGKKPRKPSAHRPTGVGAPGFVKESVE